MVVNMHLHNILVEHTHLNTTSIPPHTPPCTPQHHHIHISTTMHTTMHTPCPPPCTQRSRLCATSTAIPLRPIVSMLARVCQLSKEGKRLVWRRESFSQSRPLAPLAKGMVWVIHCLVHLGGVWDVLLCRVCVCEACLVVCRATALGTLLLLKTHNKLSGMCVRTWSVAIT